MGGRFLRRVDVCNMGGFCGDASIVMTSRAGMPFLQFSFDINTPTIITLTITTLTLITRLMSSPSYRYRNQNLPTLAIESHHLTDNP